MKTILKWVAIVAGVLVVTGFLAFLYFIPPFFIAPPETFSKNVPDETPKVDHVADPAVRALAERGRYIVMTTGCIGCHQVPTAQGPDTKRYLAGGVKFQTPNGTFVSRNLTPDKDTGIGGRTDAELLRVLQSGVFPDGHLVSHTVMPWANFSHWSEEDRRAVVAYLRNLPPVRHQIPDPVPGNAVTVPGAAEQDYAGKDYGVSK